MHKGPPIPRLCSHPPSPPLHCSWLFPKLRIYLLCYSSRNLGIGYHSIASNLLLYLINSISKLFLGFSFHTFSLPYCGLGSCCLVPRINHHILPAGLLVSILIPFCLLSWCIKVIFLTEVCEIQICIWKNKYVFLYTFFKLTRNYLV